MDVPLPDWVIGHCLAPAARRIPAGRRGANSTYGGVLYIASDYGCPDWAEGEWGEA